MRFALALALLLPVAAVGAQAPVPAAAGFVGNRESKVFHLPSCKLLLKTKPESRVAFVTREEALRAGFTPCKICQP